MQPHHWLLANSVLVCLTALPIVARQLLVAAVLPVSVPLLIHLPHVVACPYAHLQAQGPEHVLALCVLHIVVVRLERLADLQQQQANRHTNTHSIRNVQCMCISNVLGDQTH